MDNIASTDTKILVVDDNPKNIVAMKRILSDLPVEIHTAESGEEALSLALRHQYAVIFLDVQMPNMDGYEVAECLGKNAQTASMPIVFVTAIHSDIDNIVHGYEVGAIDYLTKPIRPEILVAKTHIFIKLFEQQKELEANIQELDKMANNDPLTKLSNRHHFNLFFERLLRTSHRHHRSFGLLLIDLDDFKTVNDTFGHDVGDELLKIASERLKETIRLSDLLSRLGGDEFAVILADLNDPRDAEHVAAKVIKAIDVPMTIDGHEVRISASIGVATYPEAGKTVQDLFKAADIALYSAKEKGKKKYEYYSPTLDEACRRAMQIANDMPAAIRDGTIQLVYQPRVDLTTDKIVGFEALARWLHPELGNISPVEFVQVAEEHGMIHDLGECLISMALSQLEQWHHQFPALKPALSVNLSPYQFLSPDFLESIRHIIERVSIDLSYLEFEITESIFKGEDGTLEETLSEVCGLGVHIALDDFGTGYSSLSRLKQLPINVIKIDQSFVRDVCIDENDAGLVQAIIAMGQALQLTVVAEGVETLEQADFLRENGCHFVQGYYYAKPLSPSAAEDLLANGGLLKTK